MDADFEKLAESLAVLAVEGDRSLLEKTAEGWMDSIKNYGGQALQRVQTDPYARNALIGLGAGGLVGLMQPKRKLRNALTYGLVGGLGGLGLAHAFGGNAQPATGGAAPPNPAAAGKEPTLKAQKELVAKGANPYVWGQISSGLGGLASGIGAYRATANTLLNRAATGRWLPGRSLSSNTPGTMPDDILRRGVARLLDLPQTIRDNAPASVRSLFENVPDPANPRGKATVPRTSTVAGNVDANGNRMIDYHPSNAAVNNTVQQQATNAQQQVAAARANFAAQRQNMTAAQRIVAEGALQAQQRAADALQNRAHAERQRIGRAELEAAVRDNRSAMRPNTRQRAIAGATGITTGLGVGIGSRWLGESAANAFDRWMYPDAYQTPPPVSPQTQFKPPIATGY